ncbi:hypothetical protein P691DRAFT_764743 [Macrolepiota fuliginosa MF-IS2]|uniref:Uncharacterized protein n=1 Tax=Macrolepiota fuliginosa MF-IS2 TaxID=1400762 RepID=A0A9P5X3X4_9AGAR|nr:hypothetical protein P691DRAFT_764743 [Macrolepiota fuliginosa MF-IS2]
MALSKEDTADQFFPQPAENLVEVAHVPGCLLGQQLWWIANFFHKLWFITIHAIMLLVILCIALEMGSCSPVFGDFASFTFLNSHSICPSATAAHTKSLEALTTHILILESHLSTFDAYKESLDAFAACISILESSLDTLTMCLTSMESCLDSLDALSLLVNNTTSHLNAIEARYRGPLPRNFAKRADGAQVIKALTSPTCNGQRSIFLQYFQSRGSPRAIPPSLVLDDPLSPYCWEFNGS